MMLFIEMVIAIVMGLFFLWYFDMPYHLIPIVLMLAVLVVRARP